VALGTAGPAAAAQTVTVSPDSNLPDAATVNVSGTGFVPNADVDFFQCFDEPTGERCTTEPIATGRTNANGAFGPTTTTVFAVIESDIGPAQCRTGCRIVVRAGLSAARDGISFARYSSSK
jgi:hypothetical protein